MGVMRVVNLNASGLFPKALTKTTNTTLWVVNLSVVADPDTPLSLFPR